jgi:hypothetical protein
MLSALCAIRFGLSPVHYMEAFLTNQVDKRIIN